MQAGVLILPLYSTLQKPILQTKVLQKDITNKATLTSSATIRQGNNPKTLAHIILPTRHRKKRGRQSQDYEKLREHKKPHAQVWELDPCIYHIFIW